jgi:pimeloyl-ACP methyl ester carboxylesterase
MQLRRRAVVQAAISLLALGPLGMAGRAQAQTPERIGVLLMHGKNPGSANDPNLGRLKAGLDDAGMLTLMPDMPWSARRYIDGDWDKAMAEIDGHVKTLRDHGAAKIVIAGHSMGCPAAMGYAVTHDVVDGLVLLAPGHAPFFYYNVSRDRTVRDSVDAARGLVASGQGETRRDFYDNNQGRPLQVRMTAKAYLSYFDPASDAEMRNTAPRMKVPAIMVVGDHDPVFSSARSTIFDKLPANPKSRYLEVTANHVTTPAVARDAVIEWIKMAVAP